VILSSPGEALLDTFHVLVDSPSGDGENNKLQYCGIYTTVHAPANVQIDEWHSLPYQCTRRLLKLIRRKKRVGDLHARCTLRKRKGCGSDPTPTEIREWARKYRQGSEIMEHGAIQDAFDSGIEKFGFQVIKCIGYDIQLAEIIQRRINHRVVNV